MYSIKYPEPKKDKTRALNYLKKQKITLKKITGLAELEIHQVLRLQSLGCTVINLSPPQEPVKYEDFKLKLGRFLKGLKMDKSGGSNKGGGKHQIIERILEYMTSYDQGLIEG